MNPFGSVLEDLSLHVCSDCGRPFATEEALNKHRSGPTDGVAPTEAHDTGEVDQCATTYSSDGGSADD